MALPTQSTEPISIHSENLNSRPQFKEYQNVLNILADKDSLWVQQVQYYEIVNPFSQHTFYLEFIIMLWRKRFV